MKHQALGGGHLQPMDRGQGHEMVNASVLRKCLVQEITTIQGIGIPNKNTEPCTDQVTSKFADRQMNRFRTTELQ